ncbi:amidohydrolase family protein [uncultured Ilyobacter sp.]|uniref:amidohydrolase family protein n=1 Tax=uncultured Ilyobacter sp. TaxID=544433 RepID=UPI0029C9049A|nr:amidohydrolase family protein [uncultured Ilyobacter sp.]
MTSKEAISLGTKNVASALNLSGRGVIEKGSFADLLLLKEDLNIYSVIANGKFMIDQNEVIVKGTYE